MVPEHYGEENLVDRPKLSLESSSDGGRLRWMVFGVLMAISAGVSLASLWNVGPLLSANDRSRWCTVRALVDDGTYQIDDVIVDSKWKSIDIVRHEEHFYSSKPALLPTLVAGVYYAVQRVTDLFDGDAENGWTLQHRTAATTRVVLLFVNLLPMLFALYLLALMVERYAATDFARYFIVATAAVGTLLTPFLLTLNNHSPAASCSLFALFAAMRILIDKEQKPKWFLLTGFFAAFVCTNELPAALFGVLIFGLLFRESPKLTLRFFLPAALAVFAAYFYTNFLATGGWKPFYAYYGTEKYEYIHNGIPSYWSQPTGIDANNESSWLYFLHCTVGHHGIFSLSPVFLLTLTGWFGMRKWSNPRVKSVQWLGAILTVVLLGFYVSRTANYTYGGYCCGLRWLFWLIPFWLIGMIPILDACGGRRGFRWLAAGLLAISVFSAAVPLRNPWQQSWLFSLMEQWEWIDYNTVNSPPISPDGYAEKPTTWFRTLPRSSDPKKRAWVRFEGITPNGKPLSLTLREAGHRVEKSSNGELRRIYRLEVEWKSSVQKTSLQKSTAKKTAAKKTKQSRFNRTVVYEIDETAFRAGQSPRQFLVGVTGEPRAAALDFLRGLPRSRRYSVGRSDYLFTPLQKDAIRCDRAASRVLHRAIPTAAAYWHRSDVCYSTAVPFGVLKWTVTIRGSGSEGAVLSVRQLVISGCSVVK